MIRKISLLVASVALAAGVSLVAVAPAHATPNVLGAELHAWQAIDVQRTGDIYPLCTNATTFNSFTVAYFNDPYSDNGPFELGTNYLKLNASGDADHPWKLTLYNSADEELRYNGTAWVTSADGSYATADEWNTGGQVYGLYEDGYFFNSYPEGNGTFVSISAPATDPTTYTPVAEYNDCLTDATVGGLAALAKSSVIEASGGGGGSTPALDLALDLQVGAEFVGASSVITGSGLQASSAYDLTMHSDPIVIYQGTTDPSGNFTETITIPQEACLQGVHELILSGIDPDGNPVSDTKYVELGYNCEIVQLSDTAIVATAGMPDTGASVRTTIIVSVSAAVVFAFAFFVYASRRKLRFAWTNDRVASLMDDLDARLTGMEQRAKAAAARRRLRK